MSRNHLDISLFEFFKKIVDFLSLITALFLGIEAILKFIRGGSESRNPGLTVAVILLVFLVCFYFARLWKPSIRKSVKTSPSLFLPREEKLRHQVEARNQEVKRLRKEVLIKRIKKSAYVGIIIIPLFIFVDLLFWLSIQQSFFWQDLYLSELKSADIPEFTEVCSYPKNKVKISYPQDWSCRIEANPFTQAIFTLNPQSVVSIDDERVKLVVQVYSIETDLKSLDQLLAEHIKILKEKRFNDIEITSSNEITFLNQRGYKLAYEVQDNDSKMQYLDFFAMKNLTVYMVTYLAHESDFLKYEKIATEIAISLSI